MRERTRWWCEPSSRVRASSARRARGRAGRRPARAAPTGAPTRAPPRAPSAPAGRARRTTPGAPPCRSPRPRPEAGSGAVPANGRRGRGTYVLGGPAGPHGENDLEGRAAPDIAVGRDLASVQRDDAITGG